MLFAGGFARGSVWMLPLQAPPAPVDAPLLPEYTPRLTAEGRDALLDVLARRTAEAIKRRDPVKFWEGMRERHAQRRVARED